MKRACPRHGCIEPCVRCPPKQPNTYGTRNPRRDLVAHNRWARAIKKRDGYLCQVADCPTPTDRVQAHHINGIESDDGITLCHRHHHMVDEHAR